MYLLAEVMFLYADSKTFLNFIKYWKINFVERVVYKNKNRLQHFLMKTKWKSETLKPATIDGNIILK
jgi:hypothetical protein